MMFAQIPTESPIPVVFKVTASDGTNAQYEYASYSGSGWGADTLIQTVSGPLEWLFDLDSLGNSDSLACDSVMQDLTGKIALIRRGDCEFGWKALQAQKSGAIGVVIVNWAPASDPDNGGLRLMGSGASGTDVTIPGIFITLEDGEKIIPKVDAGLDVVATFEVRAFGGPLSYYCYQTPQSAIVPLEDISVVYVNTDEDNPIATLTVMAEITDPNGQVTTLSQTATDLPPLSVNKIDFDESYTPSAIGEYNILFTNSLTSETLTNKFLIDANTFTQDNGNIVPNTNGTIEPNDSTFFTTYNWTYDFGNFFRTGSQQVVATHVTFMISNPDEIYSDVEGEDLFRIRVYNADPDGNGSVPDGHFDSYNALNENGGTLPTVGFIDYDLEPTVQPFDPITVELNSPATLAPNGIYLTMVRYNGSEIGVGIPPKYAFAGTDQVAGGLSSAVFLDSLRTEGWPGYNAVVRLHLDGFNNAGDKPLDNRKISVSPNPATSVVNLDLALENKAQEVTVRILDFDGRLLRIQQFENVQNERLTFDVNDLAVGTYFLSVSTPEGFRSKKFQVIR
jgi:hypothetical protein